MGFYCRYMLQRLFNLTINAKFRFLIVLKLLLDNNPHTLEAIFFNITLYPPPPPPKSESEPEPPKLRSPEPEHCATLNCLLDKIRAMLRLAKLGPCSTTLNFLLGKIRAMLHLAKLGPCSTWQN
jgi:hypothetical protein